MRRSFVSHSTRIGHLYCIESLTLSLSVWGIILESSGRHILLLLEVNRRGFFQFFEVREIQTMYEDFFFLFFCLKDLYMRWKNLNLVFDENASFSFYRPLKYFRFGDFELFLQNFRGK
jgi:hypothetical protein